MWLEREYEAAPGKRRACSGKRCLKFYWVMPVVIDQFEFAIPVCDFAESLKATSHTTKIFQCSRDCIIGDAQVLSDGNRR